MRVNIFSGGRRIAIVLGMLATSAAGSSAWVMSPPYYNLDYRVVDGTPIPNYGSCDFSKETWGYAYVPSDVGPNIYLSLCLPAALQVDANKIAARFPIPQADKEHANAELSKQKKHRLEVVGYSVFAVAATVWLVTAVIGWIVRGFLGVPRGADFWQPTADT